MMAKLENLVGLGHRHADNVSSTPATTDAGEAANAESMPVSNDVATSATTAGAAGYDEAGSNPATSTDGTAIGPTGTFASPDAPLYDGAAATDGASNAYAGTYNDGAGSSVPTALEDGVTRLAAPVEVSSATIGRVPLSASGGGFIPSAGATGGLALGMPVQAADGAQLFQVTAPNASAGINGTFVPAGPVGQEGGMITQDDAISTSAQQPHAGRLAPVKAAAVEAAALATGAAKEATYIAAGVAREGAHLAVAAKDALLGAAAGAAAAAGGLISHARSQEANIQAANPPEPIATAINDSGSTIGVATDLSGPDNATNYGFNHGVAPYTSDNVPLTSSTVYGNNGVAAVASDMGERTNAGSTVPAAAALGTAAGAAVAAEDLSGPSNTGNTNLAPSQSFANQMLDYVEGPHVGAASPPAPTGVGLMETNNSSGSLATASGNAGGANPALTTAKFDLNAPTYTMGGRHGDRYAIIPEAGGHPDTNSNNTFGAGTQFNALKVPLKPVGTSQYEPEPDVLAGKNYGTAQGVQRVAVTVDMDHGDGLTADGPLSAHIQNLDALEAEAAAPTQPTGLLGKLTSCLHRPQTGSTNIDHVDLHPAVVRQ